MPWQPAQTRLKATPPFAGLAGRASSGIIPAPRPGSFSPGGHAGRQKLEVGLAIAFIWWCWRWHYAPVHAARHAAVHSLFDGDLRSGAGAVLRKFSKQSEEWKSEFLRSSLEMTVTAGEIVARIAIGDVRDLRTNVCVGGGNQITTSPHKPSLFVIGEGADFGVVQIVFRGADVSWAETNGAVTITDRIERAHRRQQVTENLRAMFIVDRPLLRLVYIQGATSWQCGRTAKRSRILAICKPVPEFLEFVRSPVAVLCYLQQKTGAFAGQRKPGLESELLVETVAAIVASHRSGEQTPAETIARSYQRLRAQNDPSIFISLRDEKDAIAEARALPTDMRERALYGVPVAIKDNIDAVGFPTTAACPEFAYTPKRDATAVARLREAGAIVIGKSNLDQFATASSVCARPMACREIRSRPSYVPGGSSSGSAVAVAAGIVPIALGTDTAGSGRVPAGLNNIVGLKPSLRVISTAGVVPACRTLDCVSVFALTVEDAWTAFQVMAGPDRADPYSRERPLGEPGAMPTGIRLGVPRKTQRLFFGDREYEAAYAAALERLVRLGCTVVEIDFEPFYEAADFFTKGRGWRSESCRGPADCVQTRRHSSGDARNPSQRYAAECDGDFRRVLPSQRINGRL